MHVILEIIQRINLLQHLLCYLNMILYYVIQTVCLELCACLEVQELTERETAQVI